MKTVVFHFHAQGCPILAVTNCCKICVGLQQSLLCYWIASYLLGLSQMFICLEIYDSNLLIDPDFPFLYAYRKQALGIYHQIQALDWASLCNRTTEHIWTKRIYWTFRRESSSLWIVSIWLNKSNTSAWFISKLIGSPLRLFTLSTVVCNCSWAIGIFSFCCGSDDNWSLSFHPICSSSFDWPGCSWSSRSSNIGFIFFIQIFIITSILLSASCNFSFSSVCSFVGFIMNVDARFRMYDKVLIKSKKSVRLICTKCSSLKEYKTKERINDLSSEPTLLRNELKCRHTSLALRHRRLLRFLLRETYFYGHIWSQLWIHHHSIGWLFWFHQQLYKR